MELRPLEIRPGNYLEVKDSNGWIIEVEYTFKKDGIWWASYNGGCSRLENMLPLEITEERLTKLGFEKSWCEYWKCPDDEIFNFNWCVFDSGTFLRCYIEGDMYPLTDEIKHIHRLQNLYYELTDKELKWNL